MNTKNQCNNFDEFLRSQREAIFKDDDELFNSIDTSEHTMSSLFAWKMRKKIRKQTSSGQRHVWTRLEKVAVFIIAIYTAAFVSAMSVEAIREAVWSVVADFLGISYSIKYEGTDNDPTRIIEEKREPTYLPTGYEKDVVEDTPFTYYIVYRVGDEKVLIYDQSSVKGMELLDGENNTSSYIEINGNKCFMIEYDDGRTTLAWSDSECYYTLTGYDPNLTTDEIIKIAESIK